MQILRFLDGILLMDVFESNNKLLIAKNTILSGASEYYTLLLILIMLLNNSWFKKIKLYEKIFRYIYLDKTINIYYRWFINYLSRKDKIWRHFYLDICRIFYN